jgi:photosystem II stability/assembly factor-like uncharacterized protein
MKDLFCVFLFILFFIPSIVKADVLWQRTGGPQGGYINAIVIDRQDSQIVYAIADSGIVFKTYNGGILWENVSTGLPKESFLSLAIDPVNNQTLYAGTTNGVYKTIDGGSSWNATNTGLPTTSWMNVSSVAVNPKDSRIVYAALNYPSENGYSVYAVFKTTNGGDSWSQSSTGLSGYICIVTIDPIDSQTIYAGAAGSDACGIYKTTDGGNTWYSIKQDSHIQSFAIDPKDNQVVYAAGLRYDGGVFPTDDSGIFKTVNGGTSWQAINNGLPSVSVRYLTIDPNDSNTIYAATQSHGIYKTTNGGISWVPVTDGLVNTAGQLANYLAIDPSNSQIIYAGMVESGGIYKTNNGGIDWNAVNNGLVATIVVSLAAAPMDSDTVYAAIVHCNGAGNNANGYSITGGRTSVYKTVDGGISWNYANYGLPNNGYVQVLAVDPKDKQIVYAGIGGDYGYGNVYKTIDGGSNWTSVYQSWDQAHRVVAIVIDPQNSSIVYVAIALLGSLGTESAVMKTVDAGSSWSSVSTGLYGNLSCLAIDPNNSKILYTASTFGVYKTINGGSLWNSIPGIRFHRVGSSIESLAVDPSNSLTVYAGGYLGVYKSLNGGGSWDQINTGLPSGDIAGLLVHSINSNIIYAGTSSSAPTVVSSGVFETVDGGIQWNPVNTGLTNIAVLSLSKIRNNNSILYAGTKGEGVFKALIYNAGDVNNDGYLDLTDAVLALQVITCNTLEGYARNGADVNADGKIGFEEVIYILQKLIGLR